MAVLENVVFEEHTREVDYSDKSVTGKSLLSMKIKLSNVLSHIFARMF